LIQYLSGNDRKQLPENTFSKIFTYQNLDCDGLFSILSVTDHFSYELRFEKGKLTSFAERKTKVADSNSGKVQGCTKWCLVITWHSPDGSITEDWSYLYTTCENADCKMNKIVSGRSFTSCGGGGGGGIDYEIAAFAQVDWRPYT
jgi:hypothetical protein